VTAPPAGGVRGRRAGSGVFAVALLLAFAAGAIVISVAWAHWVSRQSVYTQAHGVPDRGSVVIVNSFRGKVLEVQLDAVVDDAVSCNLHVPPGVSVKQGERIGVVVDPQDGSYCEIPGDSYGASQGRRILGFGVVAALVFCFPVLLATIQGMRRSRRRLRGISR
jgi:hypothetical protein